MQSLIAPDVADRPGSAQPSTKVASIGVIIPALDEAEGLASVLPNIDTEAFDREVCVIVSSDGSEDGTPEVAKKLGAYVLHTEANRGKSAALRDGVRAALEMGCDPLVFIDGDGQHNPAEIRRLIAPILAREADMVLGSRYFADNRRRNAPLNRYIVRSVTCRILDRLLGIRLTDPYCGFRALNRQAIDVVAFAGSRYQCELEMLFAARGADLRVAEVPITHLYGAGMTKMGARHGRFIGRIVVLSQYTRALLRGARQLRQGSMA